jgi:hypothetical protein
MAHMRWPTKLGGPVTAVHGGTVARVVVGRPSPTTIRSPEGCPSTGESRRARCARKKGRRWGGEEWPTERKSPASSVMLRRAIPVEGALPRETGASTGYAREKRSSGQDGGVDGAMRWPERQCLRWRAATAAAVRVRKQKKGKRRRQEGVGAGFEAERAGSQGATRPTVSACGRHAAGAVCHGR